jgi:peptidoglycan lytic transglycosylase A
MLGALAFGLRRDVGPPRLTLLPVAYGRLHGWAEDRLSRALPAFLQSCARLRARPAAAPIDPRPHQADFGRVGDWRGPCRRASALPLGDDAAARHFFETGFAALAVADYGETSGLFTGYYEPELEGSRRRRGKYQTPLYRRPQQPGLASRFTRAEIDHGALAGRGLAIVWVKDPVAAFFLQIQGSGRVRLGDGRTIRLGYAGQNGKPYVPVGRILVEAGAIARDRLTMAAIRTWMAQHPKAGAALRERDPSYVFFRENNGDGPIGAEGVVLTAARSLAVDRRFLPLGAPIWLEATERFARTAPLRRLVVAQDTGGAIRGAVRGDLFWGTGKRAGERAGEMNARGRYFVLLPRGVAARLAAPE